MYFFLVSVRKLVAFKDYFVMVVLINIFTGDWLIFVVDFQLLRSR